MSEFPRSFTKFTKEAYKLIQSSSGLADLVKEHLDVDPSELSAVTESLDPVERPNLQLALDHLVGDQDGSRGIGLPADVRHYPEFSIGSVLSSGFRGPAEPEPSAFDACPSMLTRRCPA